MTAAAEPRATRGFRQRFSLAAYAQILTGSMARLVLQAGYFALLVNALPLADYGIFASVLALSLILSGGGAFGFAAPLFRAATLRRRVLGAYLSAFIAYACGETAILMAIALAVYATAFHAYLPLAAFLAILVSEMVFWRLIDLLTSLNIGMGRYRHGAAAGVLGSAARFAAVALFMAFGSGSLVHWTTFYVTANALAALLCIALLWPRVRLRWETRILRRRMKEAVSFWAINTLQTFQIEADKLLVLALAGESSAGIYALSMRVVELMLLPIRSFFPPYVQSLLRSNDRFANWRRSLTVEGLIALAALVLFLGATVTVFFFPGIAGRNVAQASQWFENLPLVPVSRALLDYHREIMFAAERLTSYALVAFALAATRMGTVALVLTMTPAVAALVLPLNLLSVILYAISASVVWSTVIRPRFHRFRPEPPRMQDIG